MTRWTVTCWILGLTLLVTGWAYAENKSDKADGNSGAVAVAEQTDAADDASQEVKTKNKDSEKNAVEKKADAKPKKDSETKSKAKKSSTDSQPKKAKAEKTASKKEDGSKKTEKSVEKRTAKKEKKQEKPAAKKAEPKVLTVVQLTVKGALPEGPQPVEMFAERQTSLNTMISRIENAAEDDDVAALWLRIEGLQTGRGKLNELRQAIAQFRKSGKPVYAELAAGTTVDYLLASACDQVVMPPSGMLLMPGVRAEMTFYKGLLDKLGVKFEALQMGKYKGAAEPYTRSSLSEPLRESMEAIVDDVYDDIVTTIASDRKLEDYEVKTLFDRALFTAKSAKNAGLIDHVLYADQFEGTLRKQLKADEIKLVAGYKKKQVDTNFSGVSGLVKLMEIFSGSKKPQTTTSGKKVAVIYAVGPIMTGKSESGLFGERTLGSTTLIKALNDAAEDDNVVAIVLRINSPGGSAVASDLIWRETVRIKKPIIASMGDVAGSGGYYIAMGCNKIFAEPATITGSIGVIGGKLTVRGLYDKIGLTTEVITRGKRTGVFSMTEPFSDGEREAWTRLLRETYQQFVSKAAEGRAMSYAELDKVAQGRIYTGRMAKGLGLIDEVGTLNDAVAAAKTAAGVKADEKVELMILPKPKTLFEQLFGDPSATTDLDTAVGNPLADVMTPELLEAARQASFFRQLFVEPAVLWMPYGVQIK